MIPVRFCVEVDGQRVEAAYVSRVENYIHVRLLSTGWGDLDAELSIPSLGLQLRKFTGRYGDETACRLVADLARASRTVYKDRQRLRRIWGFYRSRIDALSAPRFRSEKQLRSWRRQSRENLAIGLRSGKEHQQILGAFRKDMVRWQAERDLLIYEFWAHAVGVPVDGEAIKRMVMVIDPSAATLGLSE
jgi:hypothetical protein